MGKTLTRYRWWVLAAVVVVIAAQGFSLHKRRVRALFEGDVEVSDEAARERGVYPALSYRDDPRWTDVDRGESSDGESMLGKPEADAEWESEVQRMHHDFKLDASSGATRVARLKSRSVYRGPWVPRFLTVVYPPDNAVFPPNLCAPFVDWHDVHNNFWQVSLRIPGEDADRTFLTGARRWRIPDDAWERIRTEAVGGKWATIEVRGVDRDGLWSKARESVHCSAKVHFTMSEDPADEAVIYRLVAPPFINRKTPDMFVRRLSEMKQSIFLSAREQYCLNCHTFSSKSGTAGKLGLQVRYLGKRDVKQRVYFAIYDMDGQSGERTLLPFDIQMTTFMGWSPDATKLAFSANQQLATFSPIVLETQWAGQPTSDIGIFDTDKGDVILLPGADRRDIIETYPQWTPDGKALIFSAARKGQHAARTQYALYQIPYNAGAGGTASPVCDDEGNRVGRVWNVKTKTFRTKSSFYVRFSPDGKWMSWTQADYGSLIKASSDLHLMRWGPRGKVKPLACNVPHAADSSYSWSSNSKWIVFASKRDDGIFARLYMTHIDDDGNASPAVRLPMTDPGMRVSFNIPEFVATVPAIDEQRLFDNVGIDADTRYIRLRDTESDE